MPHAQHVQVWHLRLKTGDAELEARLAIPNSATGLVIFAHGSGSNRLSPRNLYVAERLNLEGIATLTFDLLTQKECEMDAVTQDLRFNMPFLAKRIEEVIDWMSQDIRTSAFRMGLFASSNTAAAALIVAASHPDQVRAVVSRGGRPDLAGKYLKQVRSPTLLLVGEKDLPVLEMNREAREQMMARPRLVKIPGATHVFSEPGTLEEVAQRTCQWFQHYLAEKTQQRRSPSKANPTNP